VEKAPFAQEPKWLLSVNQFVIVATFSSVDDDMVPIGMRLHKRIASEWQLIEGTWRGDV